MLGRVTREARTLAVSGAGGFIGLRVVERALADGWRVRALDVDRAALRAAEEAGADARAGDVCDASAVREVVEGADAVVHTAAIVREDGPRELFRRVNVEGTRTVAGRASEAGRVQRFVHLSSIMVYGLGHAPNVTEDGPLVGSDNPYCETKIESERVALDHHRRGGMEVVAIRAGDVYGPRSMPWTMLPISLARRRLFVLPDGGRAIVNHVYVDNLVDAIFLALDGARPVGGEAINVTDGRATTFAEFFGYYARMLGRKRFPSAPTALLGPLFAGLALGARAIGREPIVRPAALRFITERWLRDNGHLG